MHVPRPLLGLLFASLGCNAALLPPPPGPYNVSVTTGPLTDFSRIDQLSPGPRSLMVSVFQPAKCAETIPVPYMPDPEAALQTQFLVSQGWPANLSLTDLQMPVCPIDSCEIDQNAPLVLFSPGWSATRLLYNAIASAVSSRGYTVISIEHTGDAEYVEFPDGTIIPQSDAGNINISPNVTLDHDLADADVRIRAQDASFVLDAFADAATVGGLVPSRGAVPFDTSKVVMFGHSLGGATTAETMINDTRIAGGVNIDGTLYGDSANTGLDRPVMFIAHGADSVDATWDEIWPKLTDFKLDIVVNDTQHESFMDIGADLQAFGAEQLAQELSSVLGGIPGNRVIYILANYLDAFFQFALSGNLVGTPLLQGPSPSFPEVSFATPGASGNASQQSGGI